MRLLSHSDHARLAAERLKPNQVRGKTNQAEFSTLWVAQAID
jgi:hypothetical protein